MVNFIDEQDQFSKLIPSKILLEQTRFDENPFDDGSIQMYPNGNKMSIDNVYTHDPVDPEIILAGLERMNIYKGGVEYSKELIDLLDKRNIKAEPIVYKQENVITNEEEPKPETILGNGLTNSQKWAWVIGLSFAAWALIYWSEKKLK